jgi:capsular polysaccharide transport system permease protein
VSPPDISRSARQIRLARARRLAIRFAVWVFAPTLLASIYYGCIAAPQYQSVAVISVQSSDGSSHALGPLSMILPSTGSGRDAALIREYAQSRAMLDVLVEKNQFIEHYSSTDYDWWSRLSSDPSSEELFDYFRDKIHIEHQAESGTLAVRMRAFTPEQARAQTQTIIDSAEKMVNELSSQARNDRMRLAREELGKAEKRLQSARATILELQGEGAELDPTQSAAAVFQVKTELESELAKVRAEYDAARSVMQKNAPKVIELRARIGSLKRQLDRQNKRLAGKDDDALNESIARFEAASLEKEFAQRAYEAAVQAVEVARVEASRQHRYLVTISPPSLPGSAAFPRRGWRIATVFFVSLALMGVISLLIAAAREHAKL